MVGAIGGMGRKEPGSLKTSLSTVVLTQAGDGGAERPEIRLETSYLLCLFKTSTQGA